ncbi:MAG: aspartate aminotransferase family protein [Chitinophagales bacterium]
MYRRNQSMDLTDIDRFYRYLAQTSDAPVGFEAVKAEGLYMYDAQGKAYVDLISGIAVANIGHSHPKVVNAVKQQAEKYMHVMVYGEYVESPQVQFAELLCSLLPRQEEQVFFTNSGTEAVEAALKLAKRFTGRSEVVSFANSYHGSTMGALSAGNTAERKDAFRPLIPDNNILPYNDMQALEKITSKTACVLIEPIQAEAGVRIPDSKYIKALFDICKRMGVLLIADECQTAFGRTGTFFCFEQWDVVPDILVLGKALGGGMPLGACIAPAAIMRSFMHDPVLGHLSTFGGHPVSCAAGKAALEVLMETQVMESIPEKARVCRELLVHPAIVDVRAAGLLIAVEFTDAAICLEMCRRLQKRNILTDWFLFAPQCLRMAPPLTMGEDMLAEICRVIAEELNAIQQ